MRIEQLVERAPDLRRTSREVLLAIVARNADTEFGRRHEFAGISDPEAFKRRVPLATHDSFREDLARIQQGGRGILSSNRVLGLTRTSGTTGAAKVFPRSDLMDWELVDSTRAMLLGGPPPRGKRLTIIRAAKMDASGLPIGGVAEVWYRFAQHHAPALMKELVSPPELYEADISYRDALYQHLLFALRARDLIAITCPFASGAVDLFALLRSQRERLLQDVAADDPERAREIEQALLPGTSGAAARLWPELRVLNTIVGGAFGAQMPELEAWLGPVPIYGMLYASSEATMGISVELNSPRYALLPHTVFFEFIPVGADPRDGTVELADLQPGSAYQVVITTQDGLYRYQLRDVVKVDSTWHGLPLVTIEGRANEAKIFEYSISEHLLSEAVKAALGSRLVSFCVSPSVDEVPPCYVFRIESSDPALAEDDCRAIAGVIDDRLSAADEVYRMSRGSGRLGMVRAALVGPGAFAGLRLEAFGRGAELNFQAKLPTAIVRKDWLGVLDAAVTRPRT